MFRRKLVVRRVIALGTTILSAASSGAAFEFDNVDEAAVKLEKVLAIVDGKIVFNLNEQLAPEEAGGHSLSVRIEQLPSPKCK